MKNFEKGFSPGGRRYFAPALKTAKASGFLGAASQSAEDHFSRAIRELSAEDEELPLPDDRGPIVFKDGVFQINVAGSDTPSSVDPALKGLIDSILKP